ncbi:hypothetical protein VHEMI02140 [[Torrubiella] hemipterigena]|uniref:Lysine-specific metallo-endopeptidase domain-containing protein n=1 Tax=[Torrubiella] hemipterigena TaxID=1531966 RepID=A0A0A1SNR7_9HYPO|nr:hypothetical protein VHEMI02140 [[Torrubiella] hemipterigena]
MKPATLFAVAFASVATALPVTDAIVSDLAARGTIQFSCTAANTKIINAAQTRCKSLADAGVTGTTNDVLMNRFFKASDATTKAAVKAVYTKLQKECVNNSGSGKLTCGNDKSDLCVGESYAVTYGSTNTIVFCDNYFNNVVATSSCKSIDRGMGLLHQSSQPSLCQGY